MRLRLLASVDSTMYAFLLSKLNRTVPKFKPWDLPDFFSKEEVHKIQSANFKQAIDLLKPYFHAFLSEGLKRESLSKEEFQEYVKNNPNGGSLSMLDREYLAKGVLQNDDLLTDYASEQIGPSVWKTYLFQYIRKKDILNSQSQPAVQTWLQLIQSQNKLKNRYTYDHFEELSAGLTKLING